MGEEILGDRWGKKQKLHDDLIDDLDTHDPISSQQVGVERDEFRARMEPVG